MRFIMYHYVREGSAEFPFFRYLDLEDFRKQLDGFDFVTQEEFNLYLETGKIPEGVVLTFDDGLKDHHRYVLPELVKRGLWGIFYVNYDSCSRKRLLNPHRVHVLLGKLGGRELLARLKRVVTEDMLDPKYVAAFRDSTYVGFEDEAAATESKRILNYYLKDRDSVLDTLMEDEEALVKNYYMSREDLRDLDRAGMIVGAHTVNHKVMSTLSREEQESEIKPCFEFLDETLGSRMRTYCHPYGGFRSFNQDTENILDELRCMFSINVEPKDVEATDRRHALPRYDCNLFPFGQSTVGKK